MIGDPISPDCRDNKHSGCKRLALDEVTDEIVRCECDCHIEDEYEYGPGNGHD